MNNRQDPPKHVTEGGKEGKKNSDNNKTPFGNPNAQRMWLVLGVGILAMFLLFFQGRGPNIDNSPPLNHLLTDCRAGRLQRIVERNGGNELLATNTDNSTEVIYKNPQMDLYTQLEALVARMSISMNGKTRRRNFSLTF